MGTLWFANPKLEVETWHILDYQIQVVNRLLKIRQIWKLTDFGMKDSNGDRCWKQDNMET
jgi:hypothetical protein